MDNDTWNVLCPYCGRRAEHTGFIDDHEWPENGPPIYNYIALFRCTGCGAEDIDEDHVVYPEGGEV